MTEHSGAIAIEISGKANFKFTASRAPALTQAIKPAENIGFYQAVNATED